MKTKKLKWLITAGAVFAALAASVLFAAGFKTDCLLLRDELTGEIIYCEELGEGGKFSVSYTHSVNKSPVSEHYEVRGGAIFLTQLRYSAFGAGMPAGPEEAQNLYYEDGEMVIDGFEREITYLCYFVGRVANHTLHVNGGNIPLNTLTQPGRPVLFEILEYPRVLLRLGFYPPGE